MYSKLEQRLGIEICVKSDTFHLLNNIATVQKMLDAPSFLTCQYCVCRYFESNKKRHLQTGLKNVRNTK